MHDACAWCDEPLDRAAAKRGRLVCGRCGAATTHPWPSEAELEAAYGDWYRPETGRFGHLGDALLRRGRGTLASRIDAAAPPGPVVDVGAGDGALLDALARCGRDAVGLERAARQDPRVRDESLEDLVGGYAAVVFWHSLEHLRAPRAAVRAAAQRLDRGGMAFIAVPNASSLQARVFGDSWLALDLPRHLVHLPANALVRGLREDGWKVERVSHWRGGQIVFGWLHGLVGTLPGDLDLYQSIRSDAARARPVPPARRAVALLAAAVLLPVALIAAGAEVVLRRGGTVYVEARRG